MLCGFLLVVKVVKGVIAHLGELGVKVICKRSACGKKQLDYWIFHSSLFVIHFRKTGVRVVIGVKEVKVKCFVDSCWELK